MHVQVKEQEQLTNLLNEWYLKIRERNLDQSADLKDLIDSNIVDFKHTPHLMLHYYLLEFRYNYLIDNLSISVSSFDKINEFHLPQNDLILYYYYFFKGIFYNAICDYISAKECYAKAETLLRHFDELEEAEFLYMLGYNLYDTFNGLLAFQKFSKAMDIYTKYKNTEVNQSFCHNFFGLIYTDMREFDLANKHFNFALDFFTSLHLEPLVFMVKQNLALMYVNKECPELAIQYLSDINNSILNNYKALFIEASSHIQLLDKNTACERIERGLSICTNLGIEEYLHHFHILQAINSDVLTSELEAIILTSIEYFEKQQLFKYIKEYQEILAHKYYNDGNFIKSCEYFRLLGNKQN
ncbi:TPA: hypothetical protein QCR51_005460 [Bacillus cereus]|nr:hypothetical protein [Bacillus cereus]